MTRSRPSRLRRAGLAPPNMRMQRTRSSPSARRSPLTRWPLGRAIRGPAVAAVVALLVIGCKSVGSQSKAPESLPEKCGVQAGRMVSAEEARCIARFGGLPAGRSENPTSSTYVPWSVVLAGGPNRPWSQWLVSSTVSIPEQCPWGSEMLIDRTTGVIISVNHHVPLAICD